MKKRFLKCCDLIADINTMGMGTLVVAVGAALIKYALSEFTTDLKK